MSNKGTTKAGTFQSENVTGYVVKNGANTVGDWTQTGLNVYQGVVTTFSYDSSSNAFTGKAGSGAANGFSSGNTTYTIDYDTGILTMGSISVDAGTTIVTVGSITINGATGNITGALIPLSTANATVIVENDTSTTVVGLDGAGVQIGSTAQMTFGAKYNAIGPDFTTAGSNLQFEPRGNAANDNFGGVWIERGEDGGFALMFGAGGAQGDYTDDGVWGIRITGSGNAAQLELVQRRTGAWSTQATFVGGD